MGVTRPGAPEHCCEITKPAETRLLPSLSWDTSEHLHVQHRLRLQNFFHCCLHKLRTSASGSVLYLALLCSELNRHGCVCLVETGALGVTEGGRVSFWFPLKEKDLCWGNFANNWKIVHRMLALAKHEKRPGKQLMFYFIYLFISKFRQRTHLTSHASI